MGVATYYMYRMSGWCFSIYLSVRDSTGYKILCFALQDLLHWKLHLKPILWFKLFLSSLLKMASPIIPQIGTVCRHSKTIFVIFQNNRLKKRREKMKDLYHIPLATLFLF